jgi:hypothetical protein
MCATATPSKTALTLTSGFDDNSGDSTPCRTSRPGDRPLPQQALSVPALGGSGFRPASGSRSFPRRSRVDSTRVGCGPGLDHGARSPPCPTTRVPREQLRRQARGGSVDPSASRSVSSRGMSRTLRAWGVARTVHRRLRTTNWDSAGDPRRRVHPGASRPKRVREEISPPGLGDRANQRWCAAGLRRESAEVRSAMSA